MKQVVLCVLFLLTPVFLFALAESTDSIPVLGEVIVSACEQNCRLDTIPAGLNKVYAPEV